MKGSLRWRIWFTTAVMFISLLYVLPTIPGVKSFPLGNILPDNKISLGLDLQGGISLTLDVEVDKAIENSISQAGQDLRTKAREEGIAIFRPDVSKNDCMTFVLSNPEQREKLNELLKQMFDDYQILAVETIEGGKVKYILALKSERRKILADMAMDQTVKTIRSRIDQFGVAEPDIRKQQDHRIHVQLPGLNDPERAIKILSKTAHLEFKIVDTEADIEKAKKGILPQGSELKSLLRRTSDGSYGESVIVLKKNAVLTGENIMDARTSFDSYNQAYVIINFNARGGQLFERITTENIKKQLAIVLDDKVYSAPVIQEKISGGHASITGHFSTDEAHDLAIVLRAGALPAPIKILEERTVGPSMGQESIDKGIFATMLAGVLTVAFMAIYYSFAGIVAAIVLVINLFMIMAGMAAFGATLTLPGIAGIILVIGIAVDANVVIYERIREELRSGITVRAAIDAGYARATVTILDANVTTVISSLILYELGTGPIRGFAVTLILGIVTSLFTAIFVTRILFDLWLERHPGAKLSI
ncbi:Protein translocase subunit SecD [Desulfovibrionales bacterium]